jgi:hypothetical protein
VQLDEAAFAVRPGAEDLAALAVEFNVPLQPEQLHDLADLQWFVRRGEARLTCCSVKYLGMCLLK